MHIVSKNNSETINLQTVPLEKFRNLDKDFAETFDQIYPSMKSANPDLRFHRKQTETSILKSEDSQRIQINDELSIFKISFDPIQNSPFENPTNQYAFSHESTCYIFKNLKIQISAYFRNHSNMQQHTYLFLIGRIEIR